MLQYKLAEFCSLVKAFLLTFLEQNYKYMFALCVLNYIFLVVFILLLISILRSKGKPNCVAKVNQTIFLIVYFLEIYFEIQICILNMQLLSTYFHHERYNLMIRTQSNYVLQCFPSDVIRQQDYQDYLHFFSQLGVH